MTEITSAACLPRPPSNKGKITGPKPPLRPSHVWAIRAKLEEKRTRDLALFNLAIDSKLRGCDLVALRVDDPFVGFRSASAVARSVDGEKVPPPDSCTAATAFI
jgi:hypothetical protein